MPKVNVKYNGNKPAFTDRFYGSGGTWTPGTTLAIEAGPARKLLKHPEFEEVDPFDALDAEVVETPEKPVEEVIEEPPLVNLEAMTKVNLVEYAQRNFGLRLPDTMKVGEMRDQIRMQMGKRPV